ncbi:MAG: FAD-binding oxidoreductase [Methylobacter sp.]|uniref:FAD-binding oxidoreductase n=1 Tax=Methylobacter sp. TaxID=2051955 RepID=UPI00258F7A3B|nr:2Fe-2S iron-sulfur cluster-binding protein [Methylobacter sp.]MCL7422062.1 FAD-binding oxidoreductase [Methylobacter sp.]
MVTIHYAKDNFELGEDQSVLDCLTDRGVPVPFSCRSGACQTCLMRATGGKPPEVSQQGLKDSLKLQNYFLACVCHPTEDLEVALPDDDDIQAAIPATVKSLTLLNPEIMHVALECHAPIEYRAGQFINLFQDPTLGRSYSLASVPYEDDHLHLHVRRLPQGRVSGWIHEELRPGQTVEVRGPAGDCFYTPGNSEQGLVLIGTGSGLAPLYGIVRDALGQGHTGPIHLFHGSRDLDGLYLTGELHDLVRQYTNFNYVPCLSGGDVPHGFAAGRAHDVAFQQIPDLKNWRLFLCGHPEMVKAARMKAFLAGASMKDIYADAFNVSQSS